MSRKHRAFRLSWPTLLLAGLALALPQVAQADPKDDARRHFAAGLQAARDQEYALALERFLAAQEAWPHPATLYNIARAYHDLGDLERALEHYLLFQDAAPDPPEELAPIIASLRAQLDPAPAPAPPPDPASPRPTAEDLARLQAISEELESLRSAWERRAQAPSEPTPSTPSGAPPPLEDPEAPAARPEPAPDPPPESDFLTSAYERTVVTASRVGQSPLDSPSTLTVLTDHDIRLSGATTLPDLLRRVVGVDAMALSAGHTDLSIRGFNRELNNKLLILIDGRSTYMDFIGVTMWAALPIQLEEIERIEIIRGPGSAVYGANAVTGVINLITRPPGEQPGNTLTLEAGTPGYVRTNFLTSGRTDRVAWRISGGYHQRGRYAREYPQLAPEPRRPVADFLDTPHGLQAFKANGRLDTTFGEKGFASVSAGFTSGLFEYHNIGALPNYGFDTTNGYIRGDLAWGDLLLRAFWNSDAGITAPWTEYHGQNRTLLAEVDNDAIDVELSGPFEISTGPVDHVLNVGVGYRYKRIAMTYLRGGFDTPYVEHHLHAFLNEQATVGRLGLVASLRIDRHPLLQLSETLSPRGAVLYRLFDQTTVRATAGTAFRAPNSVESYMDLALSTPSADGAFIRDLGGSAVLGTVPLSPERITTIELGVRDESSFYHTADAVLYLNRVTQLIGLDAMRPSAQPYDPLAGGFQAGETGWVNLTPEFTGIGFEGELKLHPTDGLDLFGNLNLMRIVEQEAQETTVDRSASQLKANLGATYRTPWRTDLSVAAHYRSAQEWRLRGFGSDGQLLIQSHNLPAQVLLTARAAVRPFPDESLEIAGTLWNLTSLLGKPYREHPEGQPIPGMAYATVTYRF